MTRTSSFGRRRRSGVTLRTGTRRTAAMDLLQGVVLGGRYRLCERIGAGAMGDVYRAEHEHLGRICAVKVLREGDPIDGDGAELCRRFVHEASLAGSFDHPNVVRVLDFGREVLAAPGNRKSVSYLVTELAEGEDLIDRIRARGALADDEAARIVREVAAALVHVHARGVVHRDIKPENLRVRFCVGEGGKIRPAVKLLDFGSALVPDRDAAELVRPTWVGTPAYMSPEQAQGRPVDPRSDLYACGVLLFELLTGRLPFDDPDPAATAAAHVENRPPRPSSLVRDIDPDLESIVLWCLRKRPEDRPKDAAELVQALDRWLARKESDDAVPPTPSGPPRRRRRAVLTAFGAAVAVTLLASLSALGPRAWTASTAATTPVSDDGRTAELDGRSRGVPEPPPTSERAARPSPDRMPPASVVIDPPFVPLPEPANDTLHPSPSPASPSAGAPAHETSDVLPARRPAMRADTTAAATAGEKSPSSPGAGRPDVAARGDLVANADDPYDDFAAPASATPTDSASATRASVAAEETP